MNVKETLSSLGCLLIPGALILVVVTIGVAFIYGAAWASETLLPLFSVLALVAFGVVVFVLLPLAIPRPTRGFSSVGLLIASYVFGATLWMEGLLLTLSIWGLGAVFIGFLMVGIGVVPLAMLATLLNGLWVPLIQLVLLMIMTFASRAGAKSLAKTLVREVYRSSNGQRLDPSRPSFGNLDLR